MKGVWWELCSEMIWHDEARVITVQYLSTLLNVIDGSILWIWAVSRWCKYVQIKKLTGSEFWFEPGGSLSSRYSLSMSRLWDCPHHGRSFSKTPATSGVNVCTTKLGRDDSTAGSEASRKTCPEISGKPDNSPRRPGQFWGQLEASTDAALPRQSQSKDPKSKELPCDLQRIHRLALRIESNTNCHFDRKSMGRLQETQNHRESAQSVEFCKSSAYFHLDNTISMCVCMYANTIYIVIGFIRCHSAFRWTLQVV